MKDKGMWGTVSELSSAFKEVQAWDKISHDGS